MSSPNLLQTPGSRPRRLFSARVARKFLTVSPAAPALFCSSATMALLSAAVRVGASRMVTSLLSFCSSAPSFSMPLAVGSSVCVLTAAVYYIRGAARAKAKWRRLAGLCFFLKAN